MTKQKKRREIRLSDVPEHLYNAIKKNAKKNLRSQGKEVLNHLIITDYGNK